MLHKNLTDFKHIPNAPLGVVVNQVSCVIRSSGFPGKTVVLLSAADWRYIRELNEISS
jgi:hypothetical protein